MEDWLVVVGLVMAAGGTSLLGVVGLTVWSERKFYQRHK